MQFTPGNEEDVTPSVYVDANLLGPTTKSAKAPAYEINGETFSGDISDIQEFTEFDLHVFKEGKRGRIKMDDFDIYCSTPTDSGSEYEDDRKVDCELKISLSPVPNGFIVNNSCYLSWQQWHTLVTAAISVELIQCIVCAAYCELHDAESHVNTVNHRAALQAFPPLEKMDLSITRKIRNVYHCGVCNEVFELKAENEHFGGKMHEGNLLFAINKASDLLDNYGNEIANKTETYHFKNNNHITDNESVSESLSSDHTTDNLHYVNFQSDFHYDDFDENFIDVPVFTGVSYANMAKKPKAITQNFLEVDLGTKKVKVCFDSWHMVIAPKVNRFWCMACKKLDHIRKKKDHCEEYEHLNNLDNCKVVESYVDYFIRQVDDKLYHCGHCNKLQLIPEMDDHIESNHKRTTKLVVDPKNTRTPVKSDENNKNLPIDVTKHIGTPVKSYENNKNVPIDVSKYIGTPVKTHENVPIDVSKNNGTPIKSYENNKNVPIAVNKYTGAPIRYESNENVLIDFSKNIQTPIKNVPIDVKNSKDNINSPAKVVKSLNFDSHLEANINKNNERIDIYSNNGVSHKMRDIFDDIVIFPFGYKITIPSLAYNIVCKRPNDFYCGLCDCICPERDISRHVFEVKHSEALQRTPFIAPFTYHLIRAIRDALHCAICNMPVSASKIYLHIEDPQHTVSLNKALNQNKLPPIGVKIPNVPDTPKITPDLRVPKLTPNLAREIETQTMLKNRNDSESENTNRQNVTNVRSDNDTLHYDNKNVRSDNDTLHYDNKNVRSDNDTLHYDNKNVRSDNDTLHYDNKNERSDNDTLHYDNKNVRSDNDTLHYDNINVRNDNDITKEDKVKLESEDEEFEQSEDLDYNDRTLDSIDDVYFDLEEYVYLKLKNTYIKVTNTSYNTLVNIGDGSRFCFVCESQVPYIELQKHVDSRQHLENLEMYRFLDKYEDHFLRQIYLMYHCALCNVIITRKELKNHLEWPTHALVNENSKNIKKTRKNDIKSGIKQIIVSTQKENIYLHENETKIKICLNATIVQDEDCTDENRKNKIIIFNDNVLKFPWEHWNGIASVKNGYKCLLCQRDLKGCEVEVHCESEWHSSSLDKPFEKQYAPALVRKINEAILNCVICNTEISNKDSVIHEHINGKRHAKNHDAILKESSQANCYTDCQPDVLML